MNGDFFQTLTTHVLSQKIKEIYYSKIDDYREKMPSASNIDAAKEYSKVVEIHANRSIPAAIGALSTTPTFSPVLATVLTNVVPGATYKLKDGTNVRIVQNNGKLSAQPVNSSGQNVGSPLVPGSSQADMLNWLNQMQAAPVVLKSTS